MALKFQIRHRLVLSFVIFFCASLPAWAEKYALLVGVSRYPSLPATRQLAGASNDVKLIRDVLNEKGFTNSNIKLLADDFSPSQRATRASILSSLKELALKTKTGDFVYLHFSLHGSQQPELPSKGQLGETDGLDEIILPSDIGKWNGKLGAVTNAIVDDELHIAFNEIRRNGVFVFAAFDTCHAATMSRGVGADVETQRQVPPRELGIPASIVDKANRAQRGADMKRVLYGNQPNMGGFVGFYASESDQGTPEIVAPNNKKQGLFTYHLAQALRESSSVSYQQLAQSILNRYAKDQRFFPTPIFEGNALSAPVFNLESDTTNTQWRVNRQEKAKQLTLTVHAGRLHQFGKGSIFALVASPTDTERELLGYARAEQVGSLNSTLVPIAYRNKDAIKPDGLPVGAYARLVEPKLELSFTVKLPSQLPKIINSAIRLLQEKPFSNVVWRTTEEMADAKLIVDRGYLCFATTSFPSKCTDTQGRIKITGSSMVLATQLHELSQKISRSQSLLKLAERDSRTQHFLKDVNVELSVESKHALNRKIFTENEVPTLKTGDKVFLNIRNDHNRSIDLTSLIVDSAYGITTIYPHELGESNRLEPGARIEIPLMVTATTTGLESLVIITSEAEPHELVQDFSFLAQEKFSQNLNDVSAWRGFESEQNSQSQLQWRMFVDSAQRPLVLRGELNAELRLKNRLRIFYWVTQ